MKKMTGKTVIVTGASSGIGKALALEFARQGASVVLMARQQDALLAVADEIRKSGAEALVVTGDVSQEQDCQSLVMKAIDRFGRIDVLVNNAGVSMRALFDEVDLQVIRKLMDVNFWGAVYCTKYALPYILKQKGSVVGISSIAGKKGLPARTGYSASKFALEGFLETIRTENLNRGLHVLVACPGFTASNIRSTALNEKGNAQGESPRDESSMMTAEQVASAIVQAVIGRKRDLVLTATGKLTVWLNRLFPSWSDRLVFRHMAKEPDSPLKRV